MKKLFFILLIAMMASLVWAQVTEDFEGDYFNVTSDFTDGSFIGKGGATWSYYQSRDQGSYPINGNGIILRRPSDAYLEATISGGIGNFSFQYRKAETGGNPRQLELYVNGDVVWTSSVFGNFSGADATIYTMTEDVDVAGDVTIKIKNVGTYDTNRHSTIDNISWTGYDGAAIPTIAASGTLSAFNTSVGTPSAAQSYTLQGLNLTQNISVNAPAGFEISTDNETFTSSLSLAPAFSGSVYVRLTGATLGEFSGDITHTSTGAAQVDIAVSGTVGVVQEGYFVNFEGPGETKGAYASGEVSLSGIEWNMTEALIAKGGVEADWYNDTYAARLRGHGTSAMTMLEDKPDGIGTISFFYRRYGTDAQVDWKVEYSTDSGDTWTQVGANFTAPASDDVQTFSETVNVTGNVRIRIKRATESGAQNRRLNIDDILMTNYDAGTSSIINVSGTLNPFFTEVGAPSTAQTYSLSGDDLTNDIEVSAPGGFEISSDGNTYSSNLSLSPSFDGTIYVRLTGTTAGEFSGNITHNSDGASEKTMAVSGTVLKQEPTNHPTGFAAEDGPNSYSDIKLTWVDAIGGVVPDGYLIKGSIIGFNDIANPVDGVAEESGDYIQDVAAGMETYTYTIFSGDTTYYFKIYPYTNSGDNINYKTDGVIQTVSHTTKSGPTLEEVLFPQYIQGHIADSDSNSERVAWAGRLTLKDLNPNSTYRYYGRFVRSSDGPSYNGAGVFVFVNADGTFSRSTAGTPSFNTAGTYSEFTTDSNGNYTGWFMGEPTGNERFTAEHEVYYRLMLNDGDGGTTVALRLTSQSSIKVLRFGIETSSAQGTLLWGVTDAPPKHFMFVYDNEAGTGRPINGNVIESDGIDLSNVSAIPGFYKANIEGIDGAWGMIIPNCLIPTGGPGFPGIKRIEIRDFATGDIYSWCTSPDAIWNGVDTFAPKGGLVNPLKIGCEEGGTVPVELSSFTATISANNFVQLNWVTQTETGVMGYYIYRAMDSDLASAILVSPMIAATNTSHAQSYAFVDSEIYEPGMYYYWLQNSDFDGSSNFHGPISIQFNMGGHDGSAPEIPLTTQLMAAFPNPFNPSTRIPYQLAKAGNVDIRIYNNRGQLVRSYPMGMKDAGYHSVTWDGLAEDGSECGTGIYYIRMQTGDKSYGSKAVMIK
ncbi:MAG: T9SS type A sorting domain-containing protein [Candidatus Cloacimonetes bacterium]|nr:T9SS type A sorting domain-containing protein [Candidatus Cloacimonadota bacterium]